MNDRVFEGKSLQVALEAASVALGIAEPDLDYEILEQGRPGLFGFGARNVRICIKPPLEDPLAARPKVRRRDDGRGKERPNAGPRAPREQAARTDRASEDSGAEGEERSEGGRRRRRRRRRSDKGRRRGQGPAAGAAGAEAQETGSSPEDRDEASPRTDTAPVGKIIEEAPKVAAHLQALIDEMGLTLTAEPRPTSQGVLIEVDGEDSEHLDADGGELMSSMQFLLNRMARREWPECGRIQLTANGQGQGRDEELLRLARDVGEQVKRSGRPKLLQPMNAYERRLIHMTVREMAGVGSKSEGDGQVKRVRVFKQRGRKRRRRRSGGGGGDGDGDSR